MKKYLLLILVLTAVVTVYAQKLTAEAPATVAVGDQFRIAYKADTTDVKGFKIGSIPTGIRIVNGPSTSTQHSVSMVNGMTTRTSSVTYTYIVIAEKEGDYIIPAAQVTVKGQTIYSNVLHIKASGDAPNKGDDTSAGSTPKAENSTPSSDIFIKASMSKQRVYEQEPVVLTYKIFTKVNLSQVDGKMPDFNGFLAKEISLPKQKSFHVEKVNGKPYNCVTWSQYVMFPQMSGKLEIPSIMYKVIVQQMDVKVDPFDAFFNGGSGYVEICKEIKAPSVTIQVDPLPSQPKNFSGGFGTFSLSSVIDNNDVMVEDTVCLHVKVKGVGNMSLMDEPLLNLPKKIELCDVEVTDNTTLTSNGEQGEFCYDYRFVPHFGGDYDIPAAELTYFDIQTKTYHTIRSSGFTLHVAGNPTQSSSVAEENDEEGSFLLSLLQNYWLAVACAILFVTVCLIVIDWLIKRKKKMQTH